ncbi:MAG: methyltransferase domain-containing protein [Alphaproteobacteria bacterium]|nr:methyltransferase domain-containing protein [Alphaproteobacteria bacterium]
MDDLHYGKAWDPTRHYQNAAIAADYDRARFSGPAGRLFNFLDRRAVHRALVDLPRTFTFADTPCGTGRLAEIALARGFAVHGIDIAPEMLAVAHRRLAAFGDRFTSAIADIRKLDGARSFDVVLSARFLMHFPLDEQVMLIGTLARLARRRLILTHGLDTRFHRWRRALKRATGLFQNPAAFPVTEARLADMLAAVGFREIRRHRILPLLSEAVVIVAEPIAEAITP